MQVKIVKVKINDEEGFAVAETRLNKALKDLAGRVISVTPSNPSAGLPWFVATIIYRDEDEVMTAIPQSILQSKKEQEQPEVVNDDTCYLCHKPIDRSHHDPDLFPQHIIRHDFNMNEHGIRHEKDADGEPMCLWCWNTICTKEGHPEDIVPLPDEMPLEGGDEHTLPDGRKVFGEPPF